MRSTTGIYCEDALIASGFARLYEALRRLTPRDGLSLTAASTLRRLERSGPQRLCDLYRPERVTPAGDDAAGDATREGGPRAAGRLRAIPPEDRAAILAALPAMERPSDLIAGRPH